MDPISLTGEQMMWITLASVAGVATVLCTIIIALRRSDLIIEAIIGKDFLILRILTVLFVVWATTGLSMIGRMEEAASGIFGSIVGYVFGSLRDKRQSTAVEAS